MERREETEEQGQPTGADDDRLQAVSVTGRAGLSIGFCPDLTFQPLIPQGQSVPLCFFMVLTVQPTKGSSASILTIPTTLKDTRLLVIHILEMV